jgi:glycosyltransferase involved in cell wall biosynthesis
MNDTLTPPTLAAIILTKNEERDLPACLESLRDLVTEIYVVDSGSTDRTVAIAQEYGARVLFHDFTSHASQLNWAMDNLAPTSEWLIRIDADERISELQRDEIRKSLQWAASDVTGFELARRIRFLGRDLRFGCTYPVWLVRIWRLGYGRCEDAWMDEHIVLGDGKIERIEGDLIHVIPKDLSEWTAKHNWYATRECADLSGGEGESDLTGQSQRIRWLKNNVYLHLPLFYRAFCYWFYRYVIRLGFLDGKPGLIYHFLQGFWYRFLIDAKLYEEEVIEKREMELNSRESVRQSISEV